MERLIRKYTKKWLGVPNSLTNVALYSSSKKLKLPTLSLVEECKLGKGRLFQMLRDSCDPLAKNAQPFVKTSRKWKAKIAEENVESALKMKEIISTMVNGRAGQPSCLGVNYMQSKHILPGCEYALRSYMWRHKEVLNIFPEAGKICWRLPIKLKKYQQ